MIETAPEPGGPYAAAGYTGPVFGTDRTTPPFLTVREWEFAHEIQQTHPYVERYHCRGTTGTEAVAWYSARHGVWRVKLTPSARRSDELWSPEEDFSTARLALEALTAEMARRGYPVGYGF